MTSTAKQIEVKEKPIIFSGPMVKAILEGRKVQTRRVIQPQPVFDGEWVSWNVGGKDWFSGVTEDQMRADYGLLARCPCGAPGDRLWVRESFGVFGLSPSGVHLGYKARLPEGKTLAETDGGLDIRNVDEHATAWAMRALDSERWKPSIHMPRWASRITLEIKSIRVERLQEISEADAIAEGMQRSERTGMYPSPEGNCEFATWAFKYGWDAINGKRKGCAWANNPWVWAIEFVKL